MPKRLPEDVFGDNPLRVTAPPKEAATPAATALESVERLAAEVVSEAPVPTRQSGPSKGVSSPPSGVVMVKQTIYLPPEHVQAIEDEAYERRRTGDRSMNFAEMHRQIIEEWVARRAKRLRSSSSA